MDTDKITTQEVFEMLGLKYTLWDRISAPFYRVRYIIRSYCWNLRDRIQRFKRGYAWSDVWELDRWFISTLKPMLEHMLKTHNSYPNGTTEEEWAAILQEMIDCLTLMDEDSVREELGVTFEKWTPEKHIQVTAEMEKNTKHFFELFEKWFYNLWD